MTITLFLGQQCNNNCVMCSIGGLGSLSCETDFSHLVDKMKEDSEWADTLELTGGEPTEHKDIVRLCEKAHDMGYKNLGINSNGRNFSNPKLVKKLVSFGLNMVRISLHGPEEVHNEITNADAFQESVAGIKNLQQNSVTVTVDSVMMKMNIDHLAKLYQQLIEMGVSQIGVADLLPPGKGKKLFEEMVVPYEKKKDFFIENADLFKKFSIVFGINFPRCVLPNRLPSNFFLLSPYEKQNEFSFDGGGLLSAEYDSKNRKISECDKCRFSKKCYGFYERTLDLFGEDDARKMLKKDDFQKNNEISGS